MDELISVIIPCYNDFLYIEQAIDSVLEQSHSNIEVIIVDDGSNNKTKEVLKKITPKITKLITQNNQGQSKARNVGISASKGNYIFVLDSDDFLEPTFFEKAIPLLMQRKDVTVVVSCSTIIYEPSGKRERYCPEGGNINDIIFSNVAMGSCMFRKGDWKDVGGYDEMMRKGFEDWEFYIRLLKNNGLIEVINEQLFNYRRRTRSTTTRANIIKYDLLKYIYFKHSDLYKKNFYDFIEILLKKLEKEEDEKNKKTNSLEYKIGNALLLPLRFIKKLF